MAILINKVLIVDSNKLYQPTYKRKLTKLHALIKFCSSIEALHRLKNLNDFSFILVSHLFKGSTGLELYNYLRENNYQGPIIIVTSDLSVRKLYLNGITGIIDKNINTEDLLNFLSSKVTNYFIFKNKDDNCIGL